MGIPLTKGPHHQQEQQSGPEAIRVSEALGGGSTQQVGSDATNMASPPDSAPAVTLETEEDAAMTTGGGEAEGEPFLQRSLHFRRAAALPMLPREQPRRQTARRPGAPPHLQSKTAAPAAAALPRSISPGGACAGLTTPDAFESGGDSNGGGDGEGLKEVTLRTAPQDARFPTANQVGAPAGCLPWGALFCTPCCLLCLADWLPTASSPSEL
jgi:hypothetical protein